MTKEETYYTIRKLIKVYEKRLNTSSNEWDNLNEQQVEECNEHAEIIGESLNRLVSEIDLIEEFIEDLKNLMQD